MVRGLGPRVPRDHPRPHRPGVREVPAARACAGSGSSTRTARCPPTSGRSTTSTRRSTPGGARRRGRSTAGGTPSSCERIFHKLLINFTWWLNRQDAEGNDLFSGGFLGLDNLERLRPVAPARRPAASSSPTRRPGCSPTACRCCGWRPTLAERDPAYRDLDDDVPRARGPDRRRR